jgi:DNA polymerase-3 subunit alpha
MDKYRLESRMFSCCAVSELKSLMSDPKVPKNVHHLACMIVQADCLVSQKGNEYAKLVVRDYEDEMTLFVFGEAFLKYRHLLQNEYQVLVALQPEVRQDRFSWRVLEVHPLETVLEQFAKRVRLTIPLQDVDAAFSAYLEELCRQCAGDQRVDLDVRVEDDLSELDVTMTAQKALDLSAFCLRLQGDHPDYPIEAFR